MKTTDLHISVSISVAGGAPMWRVKLLGWCAWLLRVPLTIRTAHGGKYLNLWGDE